MYAAVSSERTRHAEAVRITYDPKQISYAQLLRIYATVAHDPTEINRQGPDVGPSYRSAIFPQNAAQKQLAAYIADGLALPEIAEINLVERVVRRVVNVKIFGAVLRQTHAWQAVVRETQPDARHAVTHFTVLERFGEKPDATALFGPRGTATTG